MKVGKGQPQTCRDPMTLIEKGWARPFGRDYGCAREHHSLLRAAPSSVRREQDYFGLRNGSGHSGQQTPKKYIVPTADDGGHAFAPVRRRP